MHKYVQEKIKIENLNDDDLEKSESVNSNDEIESDFDNDEINLLRISFCICLLLAPLLSLYCFHNNLLL